MIENFRSYLINQEYSDITPSGNPSTVDDYVNRIRSIARRESVSIETLATQIGQYVERYGADGSESEYGQRSHSAVINALRRFQEFSNH